MVSCRAGFADGLSGDDADGSPSSPWRRGGEVGGHSKARKTPRRDSATVEHGTDAHALHTPRPAPWLAELFADSC